MLLLCDHMTAVFWRESVLTSCAVRTLEITVCVANNRGLPRSPSRWKILDLCQQSGRDITVFPLIREDNYGTKCLSGSSDAANEVTACAELLHHNLVFAQRRLSCAVSLRFNHSSLFPHILCLLSLLCLQRSFYAHTHTHTLQPLLFLARWEIASVFVWDSGSTGRSEAELAALRARNVELATQLFRSFLPRR